MNNFDFDLGIGSVRPKSLNDQKNNSNTSFSYMSSSSSSSTTPHYSQPKQSSAMPSWQSGKPSWTHQPSPSSTGMAWSELGGSTSMVGDIFGKSWGSTTPAKSGQSRVNIGVVNGKNPSLFGDLVGAALGGSKSSSNVPLKNAGPVKGSFSMGGMADSLPKTSNAGGNVGVRKNVCTGSGTGFGNSQSFGGVSNSSSVYGSNGVNKSSSMGNMGGGSMRNVGGTGAGGGIGMGKSSNKDPFGSLVDFSMKPMGGCSLNSDTKATTASTSTEDFGFGDFQNASKSSTSVFPSGNNNSNSWGANLGSVSGVDSFPPQKTNPAPVQQSIGGGGGDSFDIFFSASAGSGGTAASGSAAGGQQFSGADDWGFVSEYGGVHDGGSTTELEGLPPPPAGVSASTAKSKGLDNYKQGQFADAIKWLSWAEVLLEKAGETAGTMEVLTCRASCYKEVGEYKKAVADCTKVLDHDRANVLVLVQRALLYESMEKYRLGADDLRTVMKLDPSNRVARSTIHRLNKLAD